MSFLVIIPTYNEAENIGQIIDAVRSLKRDFHILVVDDGSTDGTQAIVENKIKQYEGSVFIAQREKKMGLGSAYIHGFKWALNQAYRYIAEMDADFSHPVEKLEQFYALLEETGGNDVVIGSRYVPGGMIEHWSFSRKLISRMGSIYARLLTGIPVKDTTAGFIAYRRKVLEQLNFEVLSAQGYVFQIEIKLASWLLGFRIKEIPIKFVNRCYGVSKMNSSIIKEAMIRLLHIAYLLHTGKYKKIVASKEYKKTFTP